MNDQLAFVQNLPYLLGTVALGLIIFSSCIITGRRIVTWLGIPTDGEELPPKIRFAPLPPPVVLPHQRDKQGLNADQRRQEWEQQAQACAAARWCYERALHWCAMHEQLKNMPEQLLLQLGATDAKRLKAELATAAAGAEAKALRAAELMQKNEGLTHCMDLKSEFEQHHSRVNAAMGDLNLEQGRRKLILLMLVALVLALVALVSVWGA